MSFDLFALQRKHPRPKSLSDSYDDNTPQRLREIVRKSDADIAWEDFKRLLGPHLPAGTYEEVAYFLPLAFEYIRTHKADALDLSPHLLGSAHRITRNSNQMVRATQREVACSGSCASGRHGFKSPISTNSCANVRVGSCSTSTIVEMSETACETLSDLVQFSQDADLAETLVSEVIAFGDDATKAAWLLELVRARDDVYHPPVIARLEQPLMSYPISGTPIGWSKETTR